MIMDLAFMVLFGGLLAYAGLLDARKNEVPDIFTALMWLAVYVADVNTRLAVGSFAVLYTLAVFYSVLLKKDKMGFADVLGFPPFIAAMMVFGNVGIVAGLTAVAIFDVVCYVRKSGQPAFPYMAAAFWAAAFASVLI